MQLGLRAAHEEALLDDLAVLDRVKADFIEAQAILTLGRDFHLEANDELIAVHIGTLDLDIVHLVVRIPPLSFSFDRLAPFEHRHFAGHRLAAHDVIGPEFLAGGVELALRAHVGESLRELLRIHGITSSLYHVLSAARTVVVAARCGVSKATAERGGPLFGKDDG